MNDIQKRTRLMAVYRSKKWAERVSKMSETQVTAIYLRFLRSGKI